MIDNYNIPQSYLILYLVFNCSTALWCTVIIIYRILTVIRAACKAGGSLRAYRHTIEVLVLIESSALYSISWILYIVAYAYGDLSVHYFNFLVVIARVCSYFFSVFYLTDII